jgi:hypothetical protein
MSRRRVIITHGATSALFVLIEGQLAVTRRSLTILWRMPLCAVDGDVIDISREV